MSALYRLLHLDFRRHPKPLSPAELIRARTRALTEKMSAQCVAQPVPTPPGFISADGLEEEITGKHKVK